MEVAEAPIVVRDAFPAEVRIDGLATHRSARVVVTADRVLVYLTRAAPVIDAPYDPGRSVVPRYNAPAREPAHLALTDGRTLVVSRQRGCGCGSPLRGWRPWSPWRVAA